MGKESPESSSPAPSMALPLLLLLLSGVLILSRSAARPSPKAPNGTTSPTEVTLAVVLPERNPRYPWAWPRIGPALRLAMEVLQPDLEEAGLSVRTVFASADLNGSCSGEVAVKEAMRLKISQNPDVLVGVGCNTRTFLVGFQAGWMDAYYVSGLYYRDAEDVVITRQVVPRWAPEIRDLLPLLHQHFNWTSCTTFAFSRQADHFQLLKEYPIDRQPRKHLCFSLTYDKPEEVVEFVRVNGPVVYITGSLEMLQQIMRLAQAQNMTNGDYVFFYLDILQESLKAEGHREASKPWQSKEGQDGGGLREAFQTVLVITFHETWTPEYQHFHSQVLLCAQKDHGVELGDSLWKNEFAARCHDGLLLYIRALKEILREGGTKRDASRILKKMMDLTDQGVAGAVFIHKNPFQEFFSIWTMADVESGEYQVVGRFFLFEKQIKWMGPIHWKKGGPPLDNKSCVFDVDDPSSGWWLLTGAGLPGSSQVQ